MKRLASVKGFVRFFLSVVMCLVVLAGSSEGFFHKKKLPASPEDHLTSVSAMAASQDPSVGEVLSSLGKGPILGNPNAPVTAVEFSDFQCSFCKRFWADTLPQLKEVYIDKGRLRLIYRHFAILGQHSVEAAKGAECAGEQGRFWEYHDKLFKNQGGLAFTNSRLRQYAQGLGLKMPSFTRCLESDKYLKKIDGETAAAAFLGARGTPAFFINDRFLVGAQPFKVFQKVVEEEIKKGKSKKTGG